MGGKKKNMANKLAKMSDEERARYMQRRADIEEEAKKRKEQLISTFMKNKIKKEEGFARLNIAKINQQWHQILRFNKCKEMKDDVEHMKKYISRVLNYKNQTIEKLLEELEMAEEQYSHNFQSHMTHIDKILDYQECEMSKMNHQFHSDLNQIIERGNKEKHELVTKALYNQNHIKTVTFGQETFLQADQSNDKERYLKKKLDATSTFRVRFEAFIKRRETISGDIWRQIAVLVSDYIRKSDPRRSHIAELRRLDAESAQEIAINQERIHRQEQEIVALDEKYKELKQSRAQKIASLAAQLSNDNAAFFGARRHFRKGVDLDGRKLARLATASGEAVALLTGVYAKGAQVLAWAETCRRLETEREQIMKFRPIYNRDADEAVAELKSAPASEVVSKIVVSVRAQAAAEEEEEGKVMPKGFEFLEKMERFWQVFSRADIDCRVLKNERKALVERNQQIRAVLRGVLEAAVLQKSAETQRRTGSAPLKRILI